MANNSIRHRFRQSVTKTVALILLFFCVVALIIDVVSLERELNESRFNSLELARVTLPHPIWNMDDVALKDIINVIFLDTSITSLILKADGEIIEKRSRRSKDTNWANLPIWQVSNTLDILHENKTIATIELVFGRNEMVQQLANDCLIFVLLGLMLVLTITRRSLFVTENFIFKPILTLEKSAAELAGGNLEVKVDVSSSDEIGSLATSFESMRRSINELISRLRDANLELRNANIELELHNQQLEHKVEQRTSELFEKNKELNITLEQMEEANFEIMESLRYAERIQQSLLPQLENVRQSLPENFVIFKPRDIVGGDFFFVQPFSDGVLVAVIDCTGHGVPGALMTMISISCLRNILYEEGVHSDPATILQKLNLSVKTLLGQDTDSALSDDGLDAAACFLRPENMTLTYSGARIPLFYSNAGDTVMLKGDRHSIGYKRSDVTYNFNNQQIHIEKDTAVYLTTDGFIDQLGGERRFSFGNKRFKKLLTENYSKPFEQQQQSLLQAFKAYQGENEIQDDITVIGFSASHVMAQAQKI